MHFFEVLGFDLLLADESSPIPEADKRHPCFEIEADAEFDFFMQGNAVNGELQAVERDLPIGIDGSPEPITENVVECLIGFRKYEGAEEALLFR